MPYPNHPNKQEGTPILTGQAMIAYRRKIGRFPKESAPENVIICLETSLPKKMRRRYPYKQVGRFVGDMLILKRTAGKIGVMVNFGVGSPTVAALMEELVAWGVKRFVLISWAGSLQKHMKDGDIVVCDRAIRDEGTSSHYAPHEKFATPHQGLTDRLKESLETYKVGATWTTDAPYRETIEEVKAYQEEGILTVEMETSALFTVGEILGLETAAAYITGDSLADFSWQPPENIPQIEKSFDLLYSAIVEMFKTL